MEKDVNSIIAANKGLVYTVLYHYNMGNNSEAESIAFDALWTAAETYDPQHESQAQFSTYAFKCMKNALGNYIRVLKRVRQLSVVPLQDYTTELETNDTLSIIIQEEEQNRIQTALSNLRDSLTNKTKIAIFAAWEESGFEDNQTLIASKAGVSQSYTNQTLGVFKHKLRQLLKEEEHE